MSGAEKPKDGDAKPKKSLSARLMMIAGGTLVVLIFLYFVGVTIPMNVRALGGGVNETGIALTEFGESARTLATGIRGTGSGFRTVVMEVLRIVFFLGIIAGMGYLISKVLKKDDGDHH